MEIPITSDIQMFALIVQTTVILVSLLLFYTEKNPSTAHLCYINFSLLSVESYKHVNHLGNVGCVYNIVRRKFYLPY